MIGQFLMGGVISICNIVIHALVMTVVVRASQTTAVKVAGRPNLLLIAVMVATVSVLMAASASEVVVWSLAYGLIDAAPAGTDLLYFAFVNYTTLGRRRGANRALAIDGANDGNERGAVVRLVDGGHFRSAATSDGLHGCR
jgi:hypothetical protein